MYLCPAKEDCQQAMASGKLSQRLLQQEPCHSIFLE